MDLRLLISVFSSDIAVDLGTTSTRIFAKGRGIVVDEPSAVAVNAVWSDGSATCKVGFPTGVVRVQASSHPEPPKLSHTPIRPTMLRFGGRV